MGPVKLSVLSDAIRGLLGGVMSIWSDFEMTLKSCSGKEVG